MKYNSLKYKFWDLVFTFWVKYIRIIRSLSIVSLLLLIGREWQLIAAVPVIVIFGISCYIEGKENL